MYNVQVQVRSNDESIESRCNRRRRIARIRIRIFPRDVTTMATRYCLLMAIASQQHAPPAMFVTSQFVCVKPNHRICSISCSSTCTTQQNVLYVHVAKPWGGNSRALGCKFPSLHFLMRTIRSPSIFHVLIL